MSATCAFLGPSKSERMSLSHSRVAIVIHCAEAAANLHQGRMRRGALGGTKPTQLLAAPADAHAHMALAALSIASVGARGRAELAMSSVPTSALRYLRRKARGARRCQSRVSLPRQCKQQQIATRSTSTKRRARRRRAPRSRVRQSTAGRCTNSPQEAEATLGRCPLPLAGGVDRRANGGAEGEAW